MISKLKIPLSLLLLVFFVTSCGSKFSLQKRRYTKGFYFAAVKNKEEKKLNTVTSVEHKTVEREFVNEEQAVLICTNDNELIGNAGAVHLKTAGINSFKKRFSHDLISAKKETEEITTEKKEVFRLSQSIVKKRPDALDILNSISVGYYVITILVCLAVGAWYLFTYYPLEQALIIIAAILLVLLVCYWVGSLFTGV